MFVCLLCLWGDRARELQRVATPALSPFLKWYQGMAKTSSLLQHDLVVQLTLETRSWEKKDINTTPSKTSRLHLSFPSCSPIWIGNILGSWSPLSQCVWIQQCKGVCVFVCLFLCVRVCVCVCLCVRTCRWTYTSTCARASHALDSITDGPQCINFWSYLSLCTSLDLYVLVEVIVKFPLTSPQAQDSAVSHRVASPPSPSLQSSNAPEPKIVYLMYLNLKVSYPIWRLQVNGPIQWARGSRVLCDIWGAIQLWCGCLSFSFFLAPLD